MQTRPKIFIEMAAAAIAHHRRNGFDGVYFFGRKKLGRSLDAYISQVVPKAFACALLKEPPQVSA